MTLAKSERSGWGQAVLDARLANVEMPPLSVMPV